MWIKCTKSWEKWKNARFRRSAVTGWMQIRCGMLQNYGKCWRNTHFDWHVSCAADIFIQLLPKCATHVCFLFVLLIRCIESPPKWDARGKRYWYVTSPLHCIYNEHIRHTNIHNPPCLRTSEITTSCLRENISYQPGGCQVRPVAEVWQRNDGASTDRRPTNGDSCG